MLLVLLCLASFSRGILHARSPSPHTFTFSGYLNLKHNSTNSTKTISGKGIKTKGKGILYLPLPEVVVVTGSKFVQTKEHKTM